MFDRGLFTASATSGAIHALAALALVWSLPPHPVETLQRAIDVTLVPLERPAAEPPRAPDPDPDVELAAEQTIAPPEPAPPVEIAADEPPPPAMPPDVEQSAEPTHATLEESLPPVDEPPPFSTRELAHAVPASAPALPKPRAAPAPAPTVQHRPLAVAEAAHAQQRRAEEDYLVGVIRKLSQYRFVPQAQAASADGMVVTKITLARDGRVLDVALARSSGFAVLDQGVIDTVRRASPFAPLPNDLAGAQVSLTVPIAYARER